MIPWFQFSTINLGPLQLQVWGLLVSLGMLIAVMIVWKKSRPEVMNTDLLMDLVIAITVFGLIFSRIFYILFYQPAYYAADLWQVLKLWQGGLSSFGGLFGGLFGFLLVIKLKKIEKARILKIADLISYGALFGWLVGRVGCLMIHDHLGIRFNSIFSIVTPDGPRLEMALIEIILLMPLAIVFLVYREKFSTSGIYFATLLTYYASLRFILDFFRAYDIIPSDPRFFGLTPAQYFSLISMVVGIYIFYKIKLKNSKKSLK